MSDQLHVEAETTKRFNLPLSHLDYKYIENCKNTKELEKIVNILRSGEEGKFPDLERYAEKRLEELNPKSRVLRKDGPILRPGDLSGGDWKSIEDDLKNWTNTMHNQEPLKQQIPTRPSDSIIEDENLPPIRSGNVVLEEKKQKSEDVKSKKRVMPRDYNEWAKVDIDAELEKVDNNASKVPSNKKDNRIIPQIDTTGLSEEEKFRKAEREKDKGNEAFRAHDFEESVTYYSRSISLMPTAASFNNRALAYLKLESWDKAIKDCNKVLSFEQDNIKALLRRGTAHKSKKDLKKAVTDFERVLKMEANNKKAEALLKEARSELDTEEKTRQEKGGRRMVIEEVESDEEEEEEDVEHIEVEKSVVNGYDKHEELNPSSGSSPTSNSCHEGSLSSEDIKDCDTSATEKEELLSKEDTPNECSINCPLAQLNLKDTSSALETAATEQSSQSTTALLSSQVSSNTSSQPSTVESVLECKNTGELIDKASDFSSPVAASESSESQVSCETLPHVFTRPRIIQKILPSEVQKLKDNGNQLFRNGQYGDALEHYSKAISKLQKDDEHKVHVSILLSNRAACHLKIGNCVEAVKDCKLSLQHVPHSLKSLLRRAAAYEALERYADAYVDYKHVISIDRSADQAHQGASRCQASLQIVHGSKTWRDKIPPLVIVHPWEIPEIIDETQILNAPSTLPQRAANCQSSAESQTKQSGDKGKPSIIQSSAVSSSSNQTQDSEPKPEPPVDFTESFADVKAKGNLFVQKGQYSEAIGCYNTCITLRPDQIACYTNRALCYLKLNQAIEAACDCDKALEIEPKNAKALYRRALARKMSQQLKLSLQDLVELLKIEPKNTAAQKEMDIVKQAYKEELEKLKQKKAVEQENKVRKRIKIEEVDDEEEDEKPSRGKNSEKSKSQNKSRIASGAKSKGVNGRGGGSSMTSGPQSPEVLSNQDQPVAPPIAPRLMKTTPYEFCQAWNSLKPCQGVQPYAEILRQISPQDLPTVISNKLDGQMLQIIVKCVHEEVVLKGDHDRGFEILNKLCEVPRFSTVSMFMSTKEKKEVSSVLDVLSKTSSSAYTSADITRLKANYSVK